MVFPVVLAMVLLVVLAVALAVLPLAGVVATVSDVGVVTGTLTATVTAVGTVAVRAQVTVDRVIGVTFDNVPAFVVALDHPLELPGYGTVPVDIVFGGQFYVQAKAADLGVQLVPSAAKELARAGSVLRTVAQQKFPVQHPLNPDIDHVALTMIHGPSPTPGRSGIARRFRNGRRAAGRRWRGRGPCLRGSAPAAAACPA